MKKHGRLLAFILAFSLVFTTFGANFSDIRAYAAQETDQNLEEGEKSIFEPLDEIKEEDTEGKEESDASEGLSEEAKEDEEAAEPSKEAEEAVEASSDETVEADASEEETEESKEPEQEVTTGDDTTEKSSEPVDAATGESTEAVEENKDESTAEVSAENNEETAAPAEEVKEESEDNKETANEATEAATEASSEETTEETVEESTDASSEAATELTSEEEETDVEAATEATTLEEEEEEEEEDEDASETGSSKKKEKKEKEEKEEKKEKKIEKTEPFSESVEMDGINIVASAEAGVLPNDAYLDVKKVSSGKEAAIGDMIDEQLGEEQEVDSTFSYDINIRSESCVTDDNPKGYVQPEDGKTVSVTFESIEAAQDDSLSLSVYHVEDDLSSASEVASEGTEATDIGFEAEHFSIYTVTIIRNENGSDEEYTFKISLYDTDGNPIGEFDSSELFDAKISATVKVEDIAPVIDGYNFDRAEFSGEIFDEFIIEGYDPNPGNPQTKNNLVVNVCKTIKSDGSVEYEKIGILTRGIIPHSVKFIYKKAEVVSSYTANDHISLTITDKNISQDLNDLQVLISVGDNSGFEEIGKIKSGAGVVNKFTYQLANAIDEKTAIQFQIGNSTVGKLTKAQIIDAYNRYQKAHNGGENTGYDFAFSLSELGVKTPEHTLTVIDRFIADNGQKEDHIRENVKVDKDGKYSVEILKHPYFDDVAWFERIGYEYKGFTKKENGNETGSGDKNEKTVTGTLTADTEIVFEFKQVETEKIAFFVLGKNNNLEEGKKENGPQSNEYYLP